MTKQTKITAKTAPAIEYLPMAKLYLSDLNPRQEADEEGIKMLADSLVACGLIQNLSGLKDKKGMVGIVAGGRRLRALRLAIEQDPSLDPVPVRLAPDAATAEAWANVENSTRADLHPADEIRAFGKMYAKTKDAASIAKVFGTTEAHVYRRLALAELPSPILDALKAGEINLTMATAFTVCDDVKHSLEVLEMVRGEAISAHRLKSLLKPDAVASTDRRAVFVGKEAYTTAGGKIGGDLFSDEQTFDDPQILAECFEAALNDAARKLVEVEGWKWAEVINDSYIGYWTIEEMKLERVYPVEGVLTEDQAERYDELAELANGDALDDAGQEELDALQAILDGEYTAEQKAHAGLVAYVDNSGKLCVEAGLIRREDKQAAIEAGVLEASRHIKDDTPKSPYSQKLAGDLFCIARGARQNASLENPDLLLDLLAFQLSGGMGFRTAFGIRTDDVANMPSTETGYQFDERLTTPASRPKDPWGSDLARAFKAFQKKGKAHRDAELTRHLAALLTAEDDKLGALIDKTTGTSIRSVWTPTAENFFKRVSGAHLEGIYQSLLDLDPQDAKAKAFAKLKKTDKAARLEDLFSDEATQKALGVTKEQKARIKAWVPEYFGYSISSSS